jgi:hypothetical protein
MQTQHRKMEQATLINRRPTYLCRVCLIHGCTQALGEGVVHVGHLATHLGGGGLWDRRTSTGSAERTAQGV